MRKIRVKTLVPSWNFCNCDGPTPDCRPSKELCKHCSKDKHGYYCTLFDERLATEPNFVNKTRACIRASAGYQDEPPAATRVDPQFIIAETITEYDKQVKYLLKQGYPREMSEKLAKRLMTDK